MKKVFFIASIVFLLFYTSTFSYAQESTVVPLASGSAIPITPTPTQPVYQLPYPGLLPDSPLYFLKITRDRIVSFLISDPSKKSEFNLLESNKRLQAGVFLLKKSPEKEDLALSTISKGQNYFEEAFGSFYEAKKQGMASSDLAQKLSLAAKTQNEVLQSITQKISKAGQEKFAKLLTRAEKIEQKANSYASQMKQK